MSDSSRSAAVGGSFPPTRHSLLADLRADEPDVRARALDALARLYWRPVYKHLRRRLGLSSHDAEDTTQAFFAHALTADTFASYDPRQARFRTFFRVCLDRFAANEFRAAGRQKRGGHIRHVPIDVEGAERELERAGVVAVSDPDAEFHREWVRSLFGLSVESLEAWGRETGRQVHFSLFERYDLDEAPGDRPTYQALADEFGIPVTQVTNYLAAARREFRRIVLARLREVTTTDAEFRAEARDLLGVDVQ